MLQGLNGLGFTHRPHSSSFLGLPYRILSMNPQKELLWGLWVGIQGVRKKLKEFKPGFKFSAGASGFYRGPEGPKCLYSTLAYQNLLLCRVPINSILG